MYQAPCFEHDSYESYAVLEPETLCSPQSHVLEPQLQRDLIQRGSLWNLSLGGSDLRMELVSLQKGSEGVCLLLSAYGSTERKRPYEELPYLPVP